MDPIHSNIAYFAKSKWPRNSRCSSVTNSVIRNVNPYNLLPVTRGPLRVDLVKTTDWNVCVKPTLGVVGVTGEPHLGARFQRPQTDSSGTASLVYGSARFHDGIIRIFVRRLRRDNLRTDVVDENRSPRTRDVRPFAINTKTYRSIANKIRLDLCIPSVIRTRRVLCAWA